MLFIKGDVYITTKKDKEIDECLGHGFAIQALTMLDNKDGLKLDEFMVMYSDMAVVLISNTKE